jgi:hypothetical protein
MCNPGFDLLSAMAAIIGILFLFARNVIFFVFKKNKDHILSLVINGVVLIAIYIAFQFAR